MTVFTRRAALRSAALAVAAGLAAVATTACAPPPAPKEVVTPAGQIQTSDGLVIDGEQIADQQLWDAAVAEGSITLYTGYTENTEAALLKQFKADTKLAVNVVRLTPNRLFERISAEYGAGRLKADVVRTSDSGFASSLSEKGVFQPYEPSTAVNLQEDVSFDGGNYYRTFDPIYTFGYNTAILDAEEAPTSWSVMTDPAMRGKIGIAQVGAGGSALALTRFQRAVLGDEFLTAYAGNRPRIFDSLGAELDSLARGEVQVGTTVVSAVNLAQARNAPVQFVIPQEGFAVYDYYTGVASTASHVNAAKVFLNWNLSKRGQNVFRELGEYPVRTDVQPPNVLGQQFPAFDSPQVHRVLPDQAKEYAKQDQAMWNGLFGYNE
ncbi:ABC transporter substrate-binding protein [Nakamurella flava]|nr:ABC transporter substrate-binding protein [Nakamurella flava]